jgi:hypothetical protein
VTTIENLGAARQFDLIIGEDVIAHIITASGNVNVG